MIKKYNEGFTLIEIIVALIVLAIAAAMMVPFFGKALTQSPLPLVNLQKATSLQTVMENIVSDSDSFLFNGKKSGPTSCADLGTLQTNITNKLYGTYNIVQNSFISFDASNNEQNQTCAQSAILKVTIKDTTGETLTSLFTIFITAL